MGERGATVDSDLLTRARAGDTEAYVALFARHHDAALAEARSLVGTADADDLVAEVFVRILGRLDDGAGPQRTLGTYLRLTLHQAYAGRAAADAALLDAHAAEVAVLDPADPRAAASPLAQTFARLTPQAQLALWLRDVDDVPVAEASELLAMAPEAVDQLARRAAEALSAHHRPGLLAPLLVAALTPKPSGDVPASIPAVAELPLAEPTDVVRWRRWRPALVAAAAVGVVGVVAASALRGGPDADPAHLEAEPALPTIGQSTEAPPTLSGLNGGRMAPALLGGLVGAEPQVAGAVVDSVADEAPTPTDTPTPSEPPTTADPVDEPSRGDATTPTAPTPAPGMSAPQSTQRGPANVAATSVEPAGANRWTVALELSNVTPGSVVRVSVDGQDALIEAVGGGWSCGSLPRASVSCAVASGDSTHMTLTVRAPHGAVLVVTVPRVTGETATTSVPLSAPAEEAADTPAPGGDAH